VCGAIALKFPTVQFGYTSLEEIFRDDSRESVGDLTALLFAKIAATSVCAGAGLVRGRRASLVFLLRGFRVLHPVQGALARA
jgi:H+/Cl- antiporter ClcA